MDLKFKVAGRIAPPGHEVFEAVADPEAAVALFHHRRREGPAGDRRDGHVGLPRFSGAFPVEVSRSCRTRRSFSNGKPARASRPTSIRRRWRAGGHTRRRHDDVLAARRRAGRWSRSRRKAGANQGGLRPATAIAGLVADARRAESLGRARHQPARGDVRLTNADAGLGVLCICHKMRNPNNRHPLGPKCAMRPQMHCAINSYERPVSIGWRAFFVGRSSTRPSADRKFSAPPPHDEACQSACGRIV